MCDDAADVDVNSIVKAVVPVGNNILAGAANDGVGAASREHRAAV